MAKTMTLQGVEGLGAPDGKQCKCITNPRTKRVVRLCFVGKSKKHRSGWAFQKGAAQACR
jgi:hypothetical protein